MRYERPAPVVSPRSRAFAAAGRHSARVRWARRLIVAGCSFGVLALLGVWFFDPFGGVPGNISVGRVTLNGSRVTMELPKLTGLKRDGKPYQVRAASGVQDIKRPNIVELNDIEARVTMSDDVPLNIVAPKGVYDSGKDFMQFPGDVRITSTTGYDIRLKNADLDFRTGGLKSQDPVSVATRTMTITADRLSIAENGGQVLFDGNVRSVLQTASEPEPLKGTTP